MTTAELASQSALYPSELLQGIGSSKRSIVIGLPKEVSLQEKRIALTPDAVAMLVRNGHQVKIERGAGDEANFSDLEYSESGADIELHAADVFEADLVLKIEPLVEKEFDYLKPNTTLVSTLNLPSLPKSYFERLNQKRVTGIGFEYIEDKVGGLPIVRAMSEIAGSTVMLIAAEHLSSSKKGKGIILGGITGVPPTKVVILGAGTVGEFAARTALGLGADIKVFDKHLYKLQRLRYALGQQVYTSILDSETLTESLSRADVVIGALRPEQNNDFFVVSEEMVQKMKANTVLIDVSIDQRGCFETSEMTSFQNPTFRKHNVIHYCVPNLPSRVAHTATTALSNIFLPFLLKIGNLGGIEEMIFANRWFMKGVYCYKGNCTQHHIAKRFDIPYRDLSLLLAARI